MGAKTSSECAIRRSDGVRFVECGKKIKTISPNEVFEPLLDSREAAPYLRIHYKTLEEKARLGLVPAMKEGKSWLFRLSLLNEHVDRQLKSNLTNHSALTPNRKDGEA
jgi:excisionase family DNA binding protein